MTGQRMDYRLLPPFGVVGDHDSSHWRTLTPRSVALDAARLLLRQDLWGSANATDAGLGRLSLLGSLCLAAGGCCNEDGTPAPPDEPAAACVLASTCEQLAANLAARRLPGDASEARGLDQMRQTSTADSVDIQRLLATVHGVRPPV
jgi:hypothetical protein